MLLARSAATATVRTSSSRRATPRPSARARAPRRVSLAPTVAAAGAGADDASADEANIRGGDDSWLTDMIADAIAEESRAARRADDGTLRETATAATNVDEAYGDGDARTNDIDEDGDIDAYTSPYAHGDVDERVEGAFVGATTASSPVAGDAAVILIGFRPEEWPRVRVLVDELGGYDVPVIPARAEHAFATLEEVTAEREPDWESPRGVGHAASRGGGFGAQRAVAFSGLDLGEVAVLVSAMESQGLPRLAVIIANEDNLRKPLGEALAVALKNARRDARRRRTSTSASAPAASSAPSTSVSASPSSVIEQVIPELVPEPTRLTDASERSADGAPPIEAHSALHDVEQHAAAASAADSQNVQSRQPDGDRGGGFMTKRELKSLAQRRGLSYEDLLAQARAAGASLPD